MLALCQSLRDTYSLAAVCGLKPPFTNFDHDLCHQSLNFFIYIFDCELSDLANSLAVKLFMCTQVYYVDN